MYLLLLSLITHRQSLQSADLHFLNLSKCSLPQYHKIQEEKRSLEVDCLGFPLTHQEYISEIENQERLSSSQAEVDEEWYHFLKSIGGAENLKVSSNNPTIPITTTSSVIGSGEGGSTTSGGNLSRQSSISNFSDRDRDVDDCNPNNINNNHDLTTLVTSLSTGAGIVPSSSSVQPNVSASHTQTLKYLVRKGVPNAYRRTVWKYISLSEVEKAQLPSDYYQSLLDRMETISYIARTDIDKDIDR